jgi:hypothetical protein
MTNSSASPRIVQALKYLKNREAGRLPSETDLVDGWEKAAGLAAGIAGAILRLPAPRFGPAAATSLQFEQTLTTDLVVEMKRLDILLPTPAIATPFLPTHPTPRGNLKVRIKAAPLWLGSLFCTVFRD